MVARDDGRRNAHGIPDKMRPAAIVTTVRRAGTQLGGGYGAVVVDRNGLRQPLQRLVVGLTRAGLSIRGSQEMLVRHRRTDSVQRVLVFPVSLDGADYIVSTRPGAPWVKSLHPGTPAELRVGRRRRSVRAVPVQDADTTRFLRAYYAQVPSVLVREPPTAREPVVFRLDPVQPDF